MSGQITTSDMWCVVANICEVIKEQRQYLSDLDSPIGDGDHGISMAKAFGKVEERLPEWQDAPDIGTLLKQVAFTVTNAVGGAMGPLFGTFFLRQAQVADGQKEIGLSTLVDMFVAAESGIRQIGDVEVGQKTLYDTLASATQALQEAEEEGKNLWEALIDFERAAEDGWKSTKNMRATKGRAARLGERSVGHLDPGATSAYFVLKIYADTLAERVSFSGR